MTGKSDERLYHLSKNLTNRNMVASNAPNPIICLSNYSSSRDPKNEKHSARSTIGYKGKKNYSH